MKRYEIVFTKQAKKDVDLLMPKLKQKLKSILENVIAVDPYAGKKLVGELAGYYSYRLSYQDRIVYQIEAHKIRVIILRVRTHYGD